MGIKYRALGAAIGALMLVAAAQPSSQGLPNKLPIAPASPTATPAAAAPAEAKPKAIDAPCGKGLDRASALCAQWVSADASRDAATWAKWSLVLSALTIAGLFVAYWQGREANSLTREAFLAAYRPWAHAEKFEISKAKIRRDDGIMHAEFEFCVEAANKGGGPSLRHWDGFWVVEDTDAERARIQSLIDAGSGAGYIPPNAVHSKTEEVNVDIPISSNRLLLIYAMKYYAPDSNEERRTIGAFWLRRNGHMMTSENIRSTSSQFDRYDYVPVPALGEMT